MRELWRLVGPTEHSVTCCVVQNTTTYTPHAGWVAIGIQRRQILAELLATCVPCQLGSAPKRCQNVPPRVGLLNLPALPRPPGAMIVWFSGGEVFQISNQVGCRIDPRQLVTGVINTTCNL